MNRFVIAAICMAVMLSGCSSDGSKKAADPSASKAPETTAQQFGTDPVTVIIASSGVALTEDDFKKYITVPVGKKYPNITIQYINTSVKGSSVNDLIVSGNTPDMIIGYGAVIKQMIDLGVYYNMDPLIKKWNFDVKRAIPETLEYVKENGPTDYLGAIPMYNNSFGLFYNKTLFDRFATPYPKDGMTWEDVGDLSKKMTRSEGGVQYRGLFPDSINRMANQLSLLQIDKTTDKSLINSDPKWKKAFELWKTIYIYPGNTNAPFDKTMNYNDNQTSFLNGQLAMMTGYSTLLTALRKTPSFEWNVVTYPQNKDAMGFSTNVDTPNIAITQQSKVKDAAFMVIQTVLSDEVQLDLSKNAKMSVLANKSIQAEYAKDITEFAGKNLSLSSLTKLTPSVPRSSKYQGNDTSVVMQNTFDYILRGEKDINTALRDADEQLNKIVADKKVK